MKELHEIKALIDAARKEQLAARNELAERLEVLGFTRYGEKIFPHPTEEGKRVHIGIQDCYRKDNEFLGFFDIEVVWRERHCHDHDCRNNCDEEWDRYSRPATVEEVVEVLRIELLRRLEQEEGEFQRNRQMANALPTEEELIKICTRIQNYLEKNPKDVPVVAKLLKVL